MKTLENSPQSSFLPMELPLMSLQADSRAKTYRLQENKPAWMKERAQVSGQSAPVSLASYDPNTQSLRTSQGCFLAQAKNEGGGLAEYSATWPRSGMMRNGTVSLLATLEPGTEGTEFGFLPTPIKSGANGAAKHRYFGSKTYRSNLHEALRSGPDDSIWLNPDFCEPLMGFPIKWTELAPAETP